MSERHSDAGAQSDVIVSQEDEEDGSYQEKPTRKIFKKRTAKQAVDFELEDPD